MGIPTVVLAFALTGCGSGKDSDPNTTTGVASGTAGGSATGSTSGTPGGTTSGTATGGGTSTGTQTGTMTGTVPLTVTSPYIGCGSYTATQATLDATATGIGSVSVTHQAFAQGCCPTSTINARADWATTTVEVSYVILNDYCDCVCGLDATYVVEGIPAGTWTLTAEGDSTQVTVK